jgi:hypothetical protein
MEKKEKKKKLPQLQLPACLPACLRPLSRSKTHHPRRFDRYYNILLLILKSNSIKSSHFCCLWQQAADGCIVCINGNGGGVGFA